MSQPPPPPNQPPSGGTGDSQEPSYGYPQEPAGPPPGQPPTPPPAGSYGYPQTPPAGGYGYPQTPPPGAYGYPQTPPGGQPNPYGNQNPYGPHATAPMPGAGGPQGGQPGGNNKKLLVILAAVVAVAVIAVGTVFVVTNRSDDEPEAKRTGQGEDKGGEGEDGSSNTVPKQDTEAEIAWEAPVPKGLEGELSKEAHGVLFHGGNIVKYEPDGMVAYNIKTGKQAWKSKFIRGEDCGISTTSSGGKALVQWGAKCEKVMGFDIAAGKRLWEKDLPAREKGEVASASYAQLAVSGETGGIAWTSGRAGYQLSDGKELWSNTDSGCQDKAYAGGEHLIALHECILGNSGKVRKLDKDGKETASWKVPAGVSVSRVYSVSPLVVGLSQDRYSSRKINNIAVLDEESLKLKTRIKIDYERFSFNCRPSHVIDTCQNIVVDKDSQMIMLETETYDGKERTTNAISGYSLTSGKMVWTAEPSVDTRTSPVGMDDGRLLTLEKGNYDGGGGVYALDPKKGGTPKKVLEFSADEREKVSDSYSSAIYWRDNTLFLVNTRLPSRIDERTNWLVAIR